MGHDLLHRPPRTGSAPTTLRAFWPAPVATPAAPPRAAARPSNHVPRLRRPHRVGPPQRPPFFNSVVSAGASECPTQAPDHPSRAVASAQNRHPRGLLSTAPGERILSGLDIFGSEGRANRRSWRTQTSPPEHPIVQAARTSRLRALKGFKPGRPVSNSGSVLSLRGQQR